MSVQLVMRDSTSTQRRRRKGKAVGRVGASSVTQRRRREGKGAGQVGASSASSVGGKEKWRRRYGGDDNNAVAADADVEEVSCRV